MAEINTKESYIELGTRLNNDNTLSGAIQLPAPHSLPSSNQFLVQAERNMNGTIQIQRVGRTQFKAEIKWDFLRNKTWWKINRWLDSCGYVFYMKFFNHEMGKIQIQRFYRGNVTSATPSVTTEVINGVVVPKYYHDCGFSVIDMGESTVKTLKTMGVD